MYRCVYCGNEYEERVKQCEGCGSRRVDEESISQEDYNKLMRHVLGDPQYGKPRPKPLPTLRRLGRADEAARAPEPDESLIYTMGAEWEWLEVIPLIFGILVIFGLLIFGLVAGA